MSSFNYKYRVIYKSKHKSKLEKTGHKLKMWLYFELQNNIR